MPAIEAEGLVKVYPTRGREVRALDGVDLSVEEGTVLGLLGPNGAGKRPVGCRSRRASGSRWARSRDDSDRGGG